MLTSVVLGHVGKAVYMWVATCKTDVVYSKVDRALKGCSGLGRCPGVGA